MLARVLIVLRARLAAYASLERAPVAALLLQALLSATLCGLARGELGPFAYGLLAVTLSGLLVAIPLSGELARLLVVDEASEWVRTLPLGPRELHLARLLHLLAALFTLALGSLLPAALLAPTEMGFLARAALILGGLEQALVLAALVLLVQALLRGRAQALLVPLQTALFVGVILAAALGARIVPLLREVSGPDQLPGGTWAWPPAWFVAGLAETGGALALLIGPAVALLALALLVWLPAPPEARNVRGAPLLARLLAPARALAVRLWVRRDERAVFEFVFDALPREPSFVLRAYPLVAVPLVFLLLGARDASDAAAEGLYALLCFTTAAYLPLVLAHVPASESSEARWILQSAPLPVEALDQGALKAVAVRLILPLYTLLALLCWARGGAWLALRLALPAALVALLVVRATWRTCVRDLPLSVDPDELTINLDWLGLLGGLGIGLTILSVAVTRLLTTPFAVLIMCALLLALEFALGRRQVGPATRQEA